jgi:glycogen(starch) synthase
LSAQIEASNIESSALVGLMHVLMTTDTVSGVWTHSRELACGLIDRGCRVTLVSFGEIPLPRRTAWMDSLASLDYRPTAFHLDWMDGGHHDVQEATRYLCSVVKEIRPDVFHSNHLCYGSLPVSLPRVLTAHGDFITWWKQVHGREPKESAWLRAYRNTIAEAIYRASALTAPTRWLLEQVKEAYASCDQQQVIANGRNPAVFNPYVAKQNSVLAVGRVRDPADQLDLLTRHSHPISVYVAAGADDWATRPDVEGSVEVRVNGVQNSVEFKNAQSESQLRQLYSSASIFAGTARYDSSGSAVAESAFSRCALILNDIPCYRELWGCAATYFRANDAESLAETIRIFSADEQLRRNYANRAFQRAREFFSARRMTDAYLRLYRTLAMRPSLAA